MRGYERAVTRIFPFEGTAPSDGLRSLVLLRHKFFRVLGAETNPQHGQRGKVLASARVNRKRMVAIEFGIWRSGRAGGSSGSVIVG